MLELGDGVSPRPRGLCPRRSLPNACCLVCPSVCCVIVAVCRVRLIVRLFSNRRNFPAGACHTWLPCPRVDCGGGRLESAIAGVWLLLRHRVCSCSLVVCPRGPPGCVPGLLWRCLVVCPRSPGGCVPGGHWFAISDCLLGGGRSGFGWPSQCCAGVANCSLSISDLTSQAWIWSCSIARLEQMKTGPSWSRRSGSGSRPWLPRTMSARRPMTSM